MRILPITTIALAASAAAPAWAGPPPPDSAKPLSTIVTQIEQKPDFRYIDEVEFEHGFYKVEYYTKDGVKHKLYIDPTTGKPR